MTGQIYRTYLVCRPPREIPTEPGRKIYLVYGEGRISRTGTKVSAVSVSVKDGKISVMDILKTDMVYLALAGCKIFGRYSVPIPSLQSVLLNIPKYREGTTLVGRTPVQIRIERAREEVMKDTVNIITEIVMNLIFKMSTNVNITWDLKRALRALTTRSVKEIVADDRALLDMLALYYSATITPNDVTIEGRSVKIGGTNVDEAMKKLDTETAKTLLSHLLSLDAVINELMKLKEVQALNELIKKYEKHWSGTALFLKEPDPSKPLLTNFKRAIIDGSKQALPKYLPHVNIVEDNPDPKKIIIEVKINNLSMYEAMILYWLSRSPYRVVRRDDEDGDDTAILIAVPVEAFLKYVGKTDIGIIRKYYEKYGDNFIKKAAEALVLWNDMHPSQPAVSTALKILRAALAHEPIRLTVEERSIVKKFMREINIVGRIISDLNLVISSGGAAVLDETERQLIKLLKETTITTQRIPA